MPTIPSIVSGSLPHSTGPYSVGYFTITHAPFQGFVLDSPTIDTSKPSNSKAYGTRSTPEGWTKGHVPALGLRRVEYSVWYPCEVSKGWFGRDAGPSGVGWLPSPVADVLEGYTRFMNDSSWLRAAYPLLRGLGGRLRIPVHTAAKPLETITPPPATPTSTASSPRKPPLLIFSHGLAGTHLTYSHVCRAMASRGYVVLSISHQDGSGPYASVSEGDGSCGIWAERGVVRERQKEGALGAGKTGKGVGGIVREASSADEKAVDGDDVFKLSYLRHNELDWSPDPQPDVMTLRSLQLDIRVHELYETYRSFNTLITSGASALPPGLAITADATRYKGPEAHEWLGKMFDKGSVDTAEVDLVGHSFGGGTLIWALERGVPEGETALPVRKAVALDPWVDPMPLPAPVKTGRAPSVPLLAINSTRFTLWSSHFSRLKRLVRAANGSLVTLIGAGHETFSDFPLLYAATAPASGLMGVIDGLVWAFLRGELKDNEKVKGREVDGGVLRTTTEGKGKDAGKERLVGEWGDVVVHELGRD